MKTTHTLITVIVSLLISHSVSAQSNNKVVVIPLSSTDMPKASPETIVSASGVWSAAGLNLPSMILTDLFFYVNSDTSPPCQFAMNYVLNNIQSRTFRRFSLSVGGSTQVSFGHGINTSDLRFGTIGGGTCVRHWVAVGIEAP